jgi:Domain of unknown function (DUF4276)
VKIGLLVECATDGPDWQVYSLWVKRLLGDHVQVEQSSAANKKQLVQQAGARVRNLLAEGCAKVFIVWDLWPAWDQGKPNMAADVDAIEDSLRRAWVVDPCVYLLCVNRMLETLLLVDGKALNAVLGIAQHKQKPGNKSRPASVPDPKGYLNGWFQQARKGAYNDYVHARKIAEQIDFQRLRKQAPEFVKFDDALKQALCAPPLAWQP